MWQYLLGMLTDLSGILDKLMPLSFKLATWVDMSCPWLISRAEYRHPLCVFWYNDLHSVCGASNVNGRVILDLKKISKCCYQNSYFNELLHISQWTDEHTCACNHLLKLHILHNKILRISILNWLFCLYFERFRQGIVNASARLHTVDELCRKSCPRSRSWLYVSVTLVHSSSVCLTASSVKSCKFSVSDLMICSNPFMLLAS